MAELHVLVTGASGFVGRHILHKLLNDGFRVTGVYNKNTQICSKKGELTFVQADLSGNLRNLPDRVDAIVHAAACLDGKGVTVDQLVLGNVVTTRNLVDYAKGSGVRAFVYLSSTSVYGDVLTHTLDRLTPIIAPGIYGVTKYLGEKLVSGASHQLSSMSIRLPGVIGAGAHSNFIATMMDRIIEGSTIKIFNPATRFNNVVEASDLSNWISTLLTRGWEGSDIMAIGAGTELTIEEIPKILMRYAEKKVNVETAIESNKPAYIIDNEYAKNNYGYSPDTLQEMLKNFAKMN